MSKPSEVERKFDMMIKCSWSYKSEQSPGMEQGTANRLFHKVKESTDAFSYDEESEGRELSHGTGKKRKPNGRQKSNRNSKPSASRKSNKSRVRKIESPVPKKPKGFTNKTLETSFTEEILIMSSESDVEIGKEQEMLSIDKKRKEQEMLSIDKNQQKTKVKGKESTIIHIESESEEFVENDGSNFTTTFVDKIPTQNKPKINYGEKNVGLENQGGCKIGHNYDDVREMEDSSSSDLSCDRNKLKTKKKPKNAIKTKRTSRITKQESVRKLQTARASISEKESSDEDDGLVFITRYSAKNIDDTKLKDMIEETDIKSSDVSFEKLENPLEESVEEIRRQLQEKYDDSYEAVHSKEMPSKQGKVFHDASPGSEACNLFESPVDIESLADIHENVKMDEEISSVGTHLNRKLTKESCKNDNYSTEDEINEEFWKGTFRVEKYKHRKKFCQVRRENDVKREDFLKKANLQKDAKDGAVITKTVVKRREGIDSPSPKSTKNNQCYTNNHYSNKLNSFAFNFKDFSEEGSIQDVNERLEKEQSIHAESSDADKFAYEDLIVSDIEEKDYSQQTNEYKETSKSNNNGDISKNNNSVNEGIFVDLDTNMTSKIDNQSKNVSNSKQKSSFILETNKGINPWEELMNNLLPQGTEIDACNDKSRTNETQIVERYVTSSSSILDRTLSIMQNIVATNENKQMQHHKNSKVEYSFSVKQTQSSTCLSGGNKRSTIQQREIKSSGKWSGRGNKNNKITNFEKNTVSKETSVLNHTNLNSFDDCLFTDENLEIHSGNKKLVNFEEPSSSKDTSSDVPRQKVQNKLTDDNVEKFDVYSGDKKSAASEESSHSKDAYLDALMKSMNIGQDIFTDEVADNTNNYTPVSTINQLSNEVNEKVCHRQENEKAKFDNSVLSLSGHEKQFHTQDFDENPRKSENLEKSKKSNEEFEPVMNSRKKNQDTVSKVSSPSISLISDNLNDSLILLEQENGIISFEKEEADQTKPESGDTSKLNDAFKPMKDTQRRNISEVMRSSGKESYQSESYLKEKTKHMYEDNTDKNTKSEAESGRKSKRLQSKRKICYDEGDTTERNIYADEEPETISTSNYYGRRKGIKNKLSNDEEMSSLTKFKNSQKTHGYGEKSGSAVEKTVTKRQKKYQVDKSEKILKDKKIRSNLDESNIELEVENISTSKMSCSDASVDRNFLRKMKSKSVGNISKSGSKHIQENSKIQLKNNESLRSKNGSEKGAASKRQKSYNEMMAKSVNSHSSSRDSFNTQTTEKVHERKSNIRAPLLINKIKETSKQEYFKHLVDIFKKPKQTEDREEEAETSKARRNLKDEFANKPDSNERPGGMLFFKSADIFSSAALSSDSEDE